MAETTVALEGEFIGRRITVRLERVRLDDGTETLRDVVRHPNAVVIVPLDVNGQVVMVRQFRKAADETLLELPAGVMDDDASPLDAARRELREETGLDAEHLQQLGDFYAAPGTMTERLYSFLATGLYERPLPADSDERITVERIPWEQALQMARAGEIHDAKTLASFLMAEAALSFPHPLAR